MDLGLLTRGLRLLGLRLWLLTRGLLDVRLLARGLWSLRLLDVRLLAWGLWLLDVWLWRWSLRLLAWGPLGLLDLRLRLRARERWPLRLLHLRLGLLDRRLRLLARGLLERGALRLLDLGLLERRPLRLLARRLLYWGLPRSIRHASR